MLLADQNLLTYLSQLKSTLDKSRTKCYISTCLAQKKEKVKKKKKIQKLQLALDLFTLGKKRDQRKK